MKILLYLFLLQIFYSTNLTAKEPNYCVDLKKYACSPGEIKDPTGSSNVSLFKSDPYNINDPQILKSSNKKINNYLSEINNEDGNQYFLQLLASLFQVEQRDICIEVPYDESCLTTLSTYLVEFLASNKPGESTNNDNPDDLLLVTTNSSFEKITNLFISEIKRRKYNDERYNKIKTSQLKDSKELLGEVIDEFFDLSDSKKQALKIKINSIKFIDCSKLYGHNQKLIALLTPNAFYDKKSNSITICNGNLQDNQSDFLTLFSLTHELAHAIDPCGITFGPQSKKFSYSKGITYDQADTEYPIPELLTCMRGAKSVNARVVGVKKTSMVFTGGIGGLISKKNTQKNGSNARRYTEPNRRT